MLMFFYSSVSAQLITETFHASGTFTVPAGVNSITVDAYGGGGAGGGSTNAGAGQNAARVGAGGGGGGYAKGVFTVTPGDVITVTVGAGGIGVSGASGGNGGNSTLSLPEFIALGGTGGSGNTIGGTPAGGAGGTGSVGNAGTQNGVSGSAGATGNRVVGGAGGAGGGPNGGDGGAARGDDGVGAFNGFNGENFGGGGGGGRTRRNGGNSSGGNGANGVVIIAYEIDVTLPIELIDFSVGLNANGLPKLNWRTASEKDNDFFSIERSRDGRNFHDIAQLPGAGDHVGILEYSFEDPTPLYGQVYYRLKQTDFDGTFSYSHVERVFVPAPAKMEAFQLLKSPMLSGEYPLVMLNGDWYQNSDLKISVNDQKGSLVLQSKAQIDFSSVLKIDHFPSLNPGFYLITIHSGNKNFTKKLLIR
jgi:hypothetical protein